MEHLDLILAAVLRVGQGGLARAGETVYGSDVLAAVSEGVFLLTAVAGRVAVAVRDRPYHGQGALLVLAEVSHAEDAGAVCLGVEVAERLLRGVGEALKADAGVLDGSPLGIGEDVDVRLVAVADGLGVLVHLDVLVGHVLEVEHPVVHDVLFTLGNEEVNLYHELGVKSRVAGRVIELLPARGINGVHDDLVERLAVHARLAGDAARGSVSAGDGAVVEEQHLCVRVKTDFLGAVYGHIGNDGTGRILREVISLLEGVDLDDIVAVESSLNDGTCLGETDLVLADLTHGVIRFC